MAGRITKKIKTPEEVNEKFRNIKSNPLGLRSDYNVRKIANTRILTRIIIILRELNSKCLLNDFKIEFGISNQQGIKDALNWLINNKIITRQENYLYKIKTRKSWYYSINPEWEKLKYG